MSVRALAFVEGATEEKFIRDVLAPRLAKDHNVFITATTPGERRKHGGVREWRQIQRDLLRYLKEDSDRFVTTMFDYYGLPTSWPGRELASRQQFAERAQTVEDGMLDNISTAMSGSFDRQRFVPYIQMHEFEALLFSAPSILGTVIPEQDITSELENIVNKFSNPEEIDDNPKTAPSKRIIQAFSQYKRPYEKHLDGIITAKRIGLETMQENCPHFNSWVTKLASLAQES